MDQHTVATRYWPTDFVHYLLDKAGLPRTTWPARMPAWTYTTTELSRSAKP